ncbi:MAG TPA: TetR/AcrR family transcriptional regulator [Burkholderiales bacterium]
MPKTRRKAPTRRKAGPAARRAPEQAPLSPDAWLDAAGGAIAEGGFDNLRVLALAKRLGVTRGSFYWHFSDHAELVVRFLERWRDRRLAELAYLAANPDPNESELRKIFRLVLREPARNARQMRVELAVREFARRDAYAARIVAEVDRARIEHVARLLRHVAADEAQARDLALLVYVATIGGRVVLTAFPEDESAIERIEQLIIEFLGSRSAGRADSAVA